MAAESSAYQHALGKSFNDLPPVLRRFVGAGKARYSGACKVTRGSTGWSRFIGLLMGLPRKTPQADFALEVDHAPHRCIWVRHFPKRKKLKTIIKSGGRAGGGVMVESVGAATLSFQVSVDDGRLLLVSQRGRFLGLPLPGFLAPQTEASIGCDGETVLVESTVTLGRRSRLMRYSFEVTEAAAETTGTPETATSVGAVASEASADQTKAPTEQAVSAATSASEAVAEEAPAEESLTVSQRAPRPADADARTVPISKADERGLRAELETRPLKARLTSTRIPKIKTRRLPLLKRQLSTMMPRRYSASRPSTSRFKTVQINPQRKLAKASCAPGRWTPTGRPSRFRPRRSGASPARMIVERRNGAGLDFICVAGHLGFGMGDVLALPTLPGIVPPLTTRLFQIVSRPC